MNFSKFLILDGLFILITISILLFVRIRLNKGFWADTNKKNQGLDESLVNIPSLSELLEQEQSSRKDGSGIEFESLIVLSKFKAVWKKGTDDNDSIASFLLRSFSASLELRKDMSLQEDSKYEIINFISFGLMTIRFIGKGFLKGKQPLLPFFFERIELKVGTNVVFKKELQIPDENNRPFFALIGIGNESRKWLSARGRGGGLALWLKD